MDAAVMRNIITRQKQLDNKDMSAISCKKGWSVRCLEYYVKTQFRTKEKNNVYQKGTEAPGGKKAHA